MSNSWNNYRLDGCIFEPTPIAAPEIQAPQCELPEHVDLRLQCSAVEDQGNANSCAANAIVGALEFHQRAAGLPVTDLSRMFVYYNARHMSNQTGVDSGTYISHVFASVLAYGACEERMWPYQEAMVLTRPTQDCFDNAKNYEAVQYARTLLGPPAFAAVSMGLPVVFGTYLPRKFYEEAGASGRMPLPDSTPEPMGSGHAMLIVGYDKSEETWLVRNSWGLEWADGGYCRIPFDTLETYSMRDHYWVVGAIEQTEGFKLVGPRIDETISAIKATAPQSAQSGLDRLRHKLRSKINSDLETAKRDFRSRLRGPGAGGGYDS